MIVTLKAWEPVSITLTLFVQLDSPEWILGIYKFKISKTLNDKNDLRNSDNQISFRIRTRITEINSYDDNGYTTDASVYIISYFICW